MTGPRGICCPSCGHTLWRKDGYVQGVTRRQGDVLNVLARAALAGCVTPTIREICDELRLRSKGQVSEMLTALRDKGYVETFGRARSMILTEKAWALYGGGDA